MNYNYYKKVIEVYPQLKENLNNDREFYFKNPTVEEFALMHKVMKYFWLSINYNCIDGEDCYFLYDDEVRSYRRRKEEGYYSKFYEVDKGFIDSSGAYISYETSEEFECYEEAERKYNNINLTPNEYIELVLYEWYNDDEITKRIQLKEREG